MPALKEALELCRKQFLKLVAANSGIALCGKEIKRKLEQGPVDHETDFNVKVYTNGRFSADPDTLRQLAELSEREIARGTGLHRKSIRLFRHGGTVTRRTHQKIVDFLDAQPGSTRTR